jgi:hypothetical protein
VKIRVTGESSAESLHHVRVFFNLCIQGVRSRGPHRILYWVEQMLRQYQHRYVTSACVNSNEAIDLNTYYTICILISQKLVGSCGTLHYI